MLPQTQWLIVVAGDPLRNRSCIYRQNFKQGYATSKRVRLPANYPLPEPPSRGAQGRD
jgi:hypothetical protein